MRSQQDRTARPRGTAVAVLVISGLIASIAVEVFLIETPAVDLPGVALGSELVLAVERSTTLFATWLLTLVVVDRALAGQLPSEVSGRGLKYADGMRTDEAVLEVRTGISRLDDEVAGLRDEVLDLRGNGPAGQLAYMLYM